jgi:hypothetical protein
LSTKQVFASDFRGTRLKAMSPPGRTHVRRRTSILGQGGAAKDPIDRRPNSLRRPSIVDSCCVSADLVSARTRRRLLPERLGPGGHSVSPDHHVATPVTPPARCPGVRSRGSTKVSPGGSFGIPNANGAWVGLAPAASSRSPRSHQTGLGVPPEQTLASARSLVQEGRPFAAHEVLEARWKAGRPKNTTCASQAPHRGRPGCHRSTPSTPSGRVLSRRSEKTSARL